MTFGQRLEKLFTAAGYDSAAAFARASGISRQVLSKILHGTDPSWATALKIADTLGVSLDRLKPTGKR